MELDIPGLQEEAPPKFVNAFLVPSRLRQGHAQTVVHDVVLGPQREGSLEVTDRFPRLLGPNRGVSFAACPGRPAC
jgi:hypothetical protein